MSPLYKEFVEIDEPFCTGASFRLARRQDRLTDSVTDADITFYASTENPSILTVYLSAVPAPLLQTLDGTFKAFLAKLAQDGFDMERMGSIIERQRLQLLESIENDPADVLSTTILAGSFASQSAPRSKADVRPLVDNRRHLRSRRRFRT